MKSGRRLGTVGRLGIVLVMVIMLALMAAPGAGASGIGFDGSPGTAAPPPSLGGAPMMAFGPDPQPLFADVTTVTGPTGDITFSSALSHRRIGSGWATWSHGYTGDVYFSDGTQVVITLPEGTWQFYFYAEPNVFNVFNVTATAQDGTTSGPIAVDGRSGATYFGFFSLGTPLVSITVDVDPGAGGFAVGEFGIGTTKPSSNPRADVAVVIYGGWDGIPVDCWVGGTAQETLYTAQDAFGEAAVLWQFYPNGEAWTVSVAPSLPAGLDAQRWQYKLVRIEDKSAGTSTENPTAASVTIGGSSQYVIYFQLVDTGATP